MEGTDDGDLLGWLDGFWLVEGIDDGDLLGITLGISLGDLLGWLDGFNEGTSLGIADGDLLGWLDGFWLVEGIADGDLLGWLDGSDEGVDDGDLLGWLESLGSMLGASVEQKAFSKGKGMEEEHPLPPLPLPPLPPFPLPLPVVGRGLVEGAADGTSLKPSQLLLSRAVQLHFAMVQAS